MAIRKICKSKRCKYADSRCEHEWWFDVMRGHRRHRMPVNTYAFAHGAVRPVKTKQEAERQWYPMFLADVGAGRDPRNPTPVPGAVTVAAFIADYTKRHCEAQQLNMDSTASRLKAVQARFGHMALRDLEHPAAIEDYRADLLEAELAHATINRYLALLRHMINWAIGRGLMTRSPFYNKLINPTGVRLLKGENQRTRRLGEGEEAALLDAADSLGLAEYRYTGHTARVMRARIEMALDFGLRRGEMLKIMNRDIDWRVKPDPILTILWGNAKNRRTRRIALVSPRVVAWLESRRVVGGAQGHPYGDELGNLTRSFRGPWAGILEVAAITVPSKGIDGDLHWHDLRHECGSRLADRNVDVRKVQELLGHSTLLTTQRYFNTTAQAVGEAQRQAMGWAVPA